MGDEPHDPLPELIASIDQAIAVAPQVARIARGHFDAFTSEGFTERQALYLTAVELKEHPGIAP